VTGSDEPVAYIPAVVGPARRSGAGPARCWALADLRVVGGGRCGVVRGVA